MFAIEYNTKSEPDISVESLKETKLLILYIPGPVSSIGL